MRAKKNARAVVIVPVASVSLSVIQFLAQLVLRDKSGHDHQLPSHGVGKV